MSGTLPSYVFKVRKLTHAFPNLLLFINESVIFRFFHFHAETTNNAVCTDHVREKKVTHQARSSFATRTNVKFVTIVCASIVEGGNDLAGRANATRVSPTVCCNLWSEDARNLDPHNGAMPPMVIIPRFFLYTLWYCYRSTGT
jgi:hypothetical protein